MVFSRIRFIGFILVFLLTTNFANAIGSSEKLGTISFPTSGIDKAQKHFVRGVAALHSFWYPEALSAFQESTKADPDFAMGYWGQAMAYNHPLWEEQEVELGKIALSKIPKNSEITKREQDYIYAVRLLYGEEKKTIRNKAYSKAMERIYSNYPNDLEAACFYSLSLLGIARNTENKLPLQIESGSIALEVFHRNSDHPCAAHYTIHAFDTPELARLALPSAKRFAQIAPASAHAQHMPAHIFIQLGMWKEATTSNKNGWTTSVAWVKRKDLPPTNRDYHSLQWSHYTNLQQGLLHDAAAVFAIQKKDMRMGIASKSNLRAGKYYPRMVAASIIETEQWHEAERNTPPKGWKPKTYSQAEYTFSRGFAAAMQGDIEKAKKYLVELKTIRENNFRQNYYKRIKNLQVWELEVQVAIKLFQKDFTSAIQIAKQATLLEAKLPAPSGPPRILKPTYELLGEVYLQANKPALAKEQFSVSLRRHRNRLRSLIGAARSANLLGDKSTAKEIYTKLLDQLKDADQSFPELVEAKEFLNNF